MKESAAAFVDAIKGLLSSLDSWRASIERAMPKVSVSMKQLMQYAKHIDSHYV